MYTNQFKDNHSRVSILSIGNDWQRKPKLIFINHDLAILLMTVVDPLNDKTRDILSQ